MNKEKVIIIIPTHNEALVIEETIEQVLASTRELDLFDIQILVFDSASTDDTPSIVRQLMMKHAHCVHFQEEPNKTGLGSAYLKAMQYALDHLQADIIVEFDADLSHQPKYIAPILDVMKDHDVVVGSRYIEGGSIPKNWSFYRKFLSIMGNHVTRLLLTNRYQDFTSGFRATRREVLQHILPDRFLSNHYAYKIHFMWLLHKKNARILEYPIVFVDRELGISKLPANSIKDALRVIFIIRYKALKTYVARAINRA